MEWLWNLDQEVVRIVNQEWNSPVLDVVFRGATWLGEGAVQAVILLALLLARPLRQYGARALIAWLLASMVNFVIKALLVRHRPSNLVETIVPPEERIFASSFASGHTITAFAIAVSLLLTLPRDARWVGVAALVLASLVALSRIYRGVHWPTDVVAGAAAGAACALAVDLACEALGRRRLR
jgi:undecaprenyl-diphosphatase